MAQADKVQSFHEKFSPCSAACSSCFVASSRIHGVHPVLLSCFWVFTTRLLYGLRCVVAHGEALNQLDISLGSVRFEPADFKYKGVKDNGTIKGKIYRRPVVDDVVIPDRKGFPDMHFNNLIERVRKERFVRVGRCRRFT